MDTKINFTRIGLFIILLFCGLLLFIFWLGKYGLEKKKFDMYTIYFTESISGLNIESPVKFKGVEVGVVNDIKINAKNSEEIQIEIKVKKNTPIKNDNFAVLGTLGLTGLKYIELKGGSKKSELLNANEEDIKVIKSKPSIFASLENSTQDITEQLRLVLLQSQKLLNNKNIKNFSLLLQNSQKSMENIEKITLYLSKKEKSLDEVIENINKLTITSNSSFKTMQDSALNVKQSALKVKALSLNLIEELKKGTFDIKEQSKQTLFKLNHTLESIDDTLNMSQELIDELKTNPSSLILKKSEIKNGPGE